MKAQRFSPDVILAHHGWGEPMVLKDGRPDERLGHYWEFFHLADPKQTNFDQEFSKGRLDKAAFRLRVRNLYNYLHFNIAGTGISRTHFQADTFPEPFRSNITVTHDGIKTEIVAKNAEPSLTPSDHVTLTRADEIVTFNNLNLER